MNFSEQASSANIADVETISLQKSQMVFSDSCSTDIAVPPAHPRLSNDYATTLFKMGSSVNRMGRKLSTLLQGELNKLGVEDIGPNQLMLLLTLRDGYSSIGDLGDQLGLKGPNLTYYINGLEEHGYVERALSHKNRRTIQLTMQLKAHQLCIAVDSLIEKLPYSMENCPENSDEMTITYDTLLRLEQLFFDLSGSRD
ncbi:MarR family transcriptional regulator [Phyllobacterium sp. SB3]